MSLDWQVGNIEDYKNVCWKKNEETGETYLNPITESLIFATIGVGFSEITEENVIDFYNRTILTADVYGMPINEFPDDGPIIRRNYTFLEVKEHIGLHTNAENLSHNKFMEKMNKAQIRRQKDLKVLSK
jgi:hypothetical protein